MVDEIEPQDGAAEAPEAPAGGETQPTGDTGSEATGFNPAFDPIRNELGDLAFSRIKDHLDKFDRENNSRFEKVSSKYKWAEDLTATGVTPERIQASLAFAQQLDEDPVSLYQRLGEFLQQNGRMPADQEELEEFEEEQDEDELDPRFEQLSQENAQIKAFLAEQAAKEEAAAADAALDSEIDQLKQAHPEFSREDLGEILSRAAWKTQMTGQPVTLEEAAADYLQNVVTRIRQTPRPGDSAPRLVPTTGGNAAVQGQRSVTDMSRGETQDLIASLIAQQNAADRS